ncbi:MAG: type I phosphodiesterase/nucleotide pyrophosphatase [Chloroflexi bacterium OLB14]|nr:MAG: type I phosphodiesterase/nucleotide pyrophosphatase [Chloroflexi bacterium OLB14]
MQNITLKMSRTYIACGLIILFLQACGSNASLPTPQPVSLSTPTSTLTFTPAPFTPIVMSTATSMPMPNVARVLIISFDGLRPDVIQTADMSNVMALMQAGAYSLSAQTIFPSLTLPSHTSMLVGTCPAKHVVRWNEYVPENGYALGTDIFDLAQAAGLKTIMVVGKEKLRHITEPQSTDFFGFVDSTDKIEDKVSLETMAIEQIRKGFDLMFIHFPDGDLAGHEYGWKSKEQLFAYKRDDEAFGLLLEVLKSRDIFADTLIIISADHGGHDTTHGTDSSEDMTIPWIISGPGINHKKLETKIYTIDTAATIAFALNLSIPVEWEGIPVYEAFGLPANLLRDEACTGTP